IHHNLKLTTNNTMGGLGGNVCTPGPIMLQGQGQPVQYRNLWLLTGTAASPEVARMSPLDRRQAVAQVSPKVPRPSSPKVTYILGIRPMQKIRADFEIRLKLPRMKVKQWCVLTARPPELIGQKAVTVSMSPRGKVITEQSPERRQVLRSIV